MNLDNICISCLDKNNLINIFDDYLYENKNENYSDMLKQGFDIKLQEESGLLSLCFHCVLMLRDAYYFREKILNNLNLLLYENGKETGHAVNLAYLDDDDDDISDLASDDENTVPDLKPILDPTTGQISYKITNIRTDSPNKPVNINANRKLIRQEDGAKMENKKNIVLKVTKYDEKADESDLMRTGTVFEVRKPTEARQMSSNGNICPVKITSKTQLSEQISADHPLHICDACGKQCWSARQLSRHLRNHDAGPFTCRTCHKVFTNINTLNAHTWRLHANKHPYACSICGERFRTYHNRLCHMKTKHGLNENRYPCPHCEKTFYDSGARSKHIRYSHLNIRPHKCTHCTKAFTKPNLLQSHLANAHRIGKKHFKCHLCDKKFSYKSSLKHHLNNHDRLVKERCCCKLCDQLFLSEADLKNHVLNNHNIQ